MILKRHMQQDPLTHKYTENIENLSEKTLGAKNYKLNSDLKAVLTSRSNIGYFSHGTRWKCHMVLHQSVLINSLQL
jgi:hypothetical protein